MIKRSNIYFVSLSIIVLLAFFMGAYVLENLGVQYVSEGGAVIFKIHLFSYVGLLVFVRFVFGLKKGEFVALLGELFWPWFFLLCSITWLIAYGFLRLGPSGMAYIVDTLLVPSLLFPIFLSINDEQKKKMIKLMVVLMAFNAITALLEFVFSVRLWPSENEWLSYFRSHAWMAHPLNNSLIMASLMPVLIFYRFINPVLLFGLTLIALFSFGARTATAIYLICSGVALLYTIRSSYIENRGLSFSQVITFLILLVVLPVVTYFLIIKFNIGARIFENLTIDASGQTRLDVFYVFNYLSNQELMYGASSDLVENISYFINNAVIENYIIGWLLLYGLIGSVPLVFALSYFFYCLFVRGGFVVRLSIISFALISVSNNALMAKTPALLFIFVVIACVVPVSLRRVGRKYCSRRTNTLGCL